VVIGISTDTLALQKKFTEKEMLNFPLFADSEQKVTKAFGVEIPGRGMAKRSTFIINKEGNIAKIYPAVGNAKGHPQEVLEYVMKHLKK
jgi:peroxiredoxin Q/BCP